MCAPARAFLSVTVIVLYNPICRKQRSQSSIRSYYPWLSAFLSLQTTADNICVPRIFLRYKLSIIDESIDFSVTALNECRQTTLNHSQCCYIEKTAQCSPVQCYTTNQFSVVVTRAHSRFQYLGYLVTVYQPTAAAVPF